ncbi:MAG: hypothetical protein LUE11_12030, partial [Clostridia bacterium]|nr:hypothetical protein [Clostridia bacterium]
SENKAYWDSMLERAKEMAEVQARILQELPEEEREQVLDKRMKTISDLLAKLLPLPDEVCTMINPFKYNRFLELVDISIAFAEERVVNLLVSTEGLTGCICFAGEELACLTEQKNVFGKFNAAADEVYIAPSVDTGKGSATDVDGGIRIEFWFDFAVRYKMKNSSSI